MRKLGLILLLLLLFMSGCSNKAPIVKTQLITEHVPVYVPLSAKLTADKHSPAVPAPECVDHSTGKPSLCNEQLQQLLDALYAWGDAMRGQLTKIRELQPKEQQ